MKKILKILGLTMMIGSCAVGLASCGDNAGTQSDTGQVDVIVKTYSVSFDNGGHGKELRTLKGISKLPAYLPDLEDEELIFAGWFYDKDFTKEANPDDKLSEDVILYAKWQEPEKPTVEEQTEYLYDQKSFGNDIIRVWKGKGYYYVDLNSNGVTERITYTPTTGDLKPASMSFKEKELKKILYFKNTDGLNARYVLLYIQEGTLRVEFYEVLGTVNKDGVQTGLAKTYQWTYPTSTDVKTFDNLYKGSYKVVSKVVDEETGEYKKKENGEYETQEEEIECSFKYWVLDNEGIIINQEGYLSINSN